MDRVVETIDPSTGEILGPLDLSDLRYGYDVKLQLRIIRARLKAMEMPRKAWLLGYSSINGDACYEVYSMTVTPDGERGPYFVRAHENGTMGGFVYALEEGVPAPWLRCSCPASEYFNPCWHSGLVQRRLEREHKEHRHKKGGS